MSNAIKDTDLFVALDGNDLWSGRRPEPNAARTDGPLATVARARDAMRQRKITAGLTEPQTVWIRGGRYFLDKSICFGPEDSGPVTYAAYPGEEPIFDGGAQITNWKQKQINSRPVWIADVSQLLNTSGGGKQLFINGQRRPRPRLPKKGFYLIKDVDGSDAASGGGSANAFRCAPGDIREWNNIGDIEIVILNAWLSERAALASFDPSQDRVVLDMEKSRWVSKEARYYVENVFEALTEPGEWYLNRPEDKIYYIPTAGESPETSEAFVSCAPRLLELRGRPDEERLVEFLAFKNLAFEHTDWVKPSRSNQADVNVPGAIFMEGARHCRFENCRIEHIGWYGIEIADGCTGNRIVGNILSDLGAGGIKANGSDAAGSLTGRTGNNRITDNEIRGGGRIFHGAVGLLFRHTFGNEISHNHIHDFFYSGISCGWVWGYGENISGENRIIKNHIHNIGQGLLADMGGIYTLGIQSGTIIRGNLIHDVEGEGISWGIYLDEGSSHMVVEDNICFNTSHESFHQHYGRENIIRNNIFAFAKPGGASLTSGLSSGKGRYAHCGRNATFSFTFEHNIVITNGRPFFISYNTGDGGLERHNFRSDLNLFWDISGKTPTWGGDGIDQKTGNFQKTYDLKQWRQLGYDLHSVAADPKCADLGAFDFSLADDSPAYALGFRPIDLSNVGPRPRDKRLVE